MVAEVLAEHPAWVRVNAARTAWCEADLAAVAEHAFGIRIPKVESAADVRMGHRTRPRQADHLRHRKRPRSARRAGDRRHTGCPLPGDGRGGPAARPEHHRREPANPLRPIASGAGLPRGRDRTTDRQRVPAAGRPGRPAEPGRVRQVPRVLRQVSDPPPADRHPAPGVHPHQQSTSPGQSRLLAAFDAAGGEAFQLPSGEFVDLPVADRARRLLQIAGAARIPAAARS